MCGDELEYEFFGFDQCRVLDTLATRERRRETWRDVTPLASTAGV
jgi:hypothetical protein